MSVFLHHELVGKKKQNQTFHVIPFSKKLDQTPKNLSQLICCLMKPINICKKVKVHFQNELYFFLANLLRDLADKISKKVKVHFGNEL